MFLRTELTWTDVFTMSVVGLSIAPRHTFLEYGRDWVKVAGCTWG